MENILELLNTSRALSDYFSVSPRACVPLAIDIVDAYASSDVAAALEYLASDDPLVLFGAADSSAALECATRVKSFYLPMRRLAQIW